MENKKDLITLCLRNPCDLPGVYNPAGSRRMIPSPPLSITSCKNFSRCCVSLHISFGATLKYSVPPCCLMFSSRKRGIKLSKGESRGRYVYMRYPKLNSVPHRCPYDWANRMPYIQNSSNRLQRDSPCPKSS